MQIGSLRPSCENEQTSYRHEPHEDPSTKCSRTAVHKQSCFPSKHRLGLASPETPPCLWIPEIVQGDWSVGSDFLHVHAREKLRDGSRPPLLGDLVCLMDQKNCLSTVKTILTFAIHSHGCHCFHCIGLASPHRFTTVCTIWHVSCWMRLLFELCACVLV